jgi:hypothetical protein
MAEASQKIAYFRSCFETDKRSLQLYSFFSSKVSQAIFLEDSDLLTGLLAYQPVDQDWGEKSLKTLSVYSKEKKLYYCAFFIFGSTTIINKKQKLIAPLLLYPAELVKEDDLYRVELTSQHPIINPSAIQPLSLRDASVNAMDQLSDQLTNGFIRFEESVFLKKALDQLFSNLNTDTLLEYPTIASPAQMKKLRKGQQLFEQEDQFFLISAAGLGILNQTRSGRGIQNELKAIAEPEYPLSHPLMSLLQDVSPGLQNRSSDNIFVPVTLNKAQEQLIRTSHNSTLNVAIGPPGTGKSFTIAALAIDAISRGQSVLIASDNQQAVEVVATKLEKDFHLEQKPIKTTDRRWKAQVKQYLENILSGMGVKEVSPSEVRTIERDLRKYIKEIDRLENTIQMRTRNEKKWGQLLSKVNISWWGRIRLSIFKNRVQKIPPLWELYQELLHDFHEKNELMTYHLSISRQYHLFKVLSQKRKELQFFLKALRARTGNLKEERFNKVNFNTLFQALPIWMVTLEDVSQVLPLRKELFDLVIFDESTQCDIASAIPLLQRGRRAVVVGDPKQLRHLSFLSGKRQEQLLEQHGLSPTDIAELDYRNKSLLDLTLDQLDDQQYIHFLNEHYRSLPDLIAFSNKKFYNKALNIMTDTPTAQVEGNLHLHPINGQRNKTGYNSKEADYILQKIKAIIEEEKGLPKGLCQSIGVLSPFREQSDHIASLIDKNLSLDALQRHQILIGTPHFFQGEERDVMFLSFALDKDDHGAAFRYLEKPDVFNVSITRARSEQHLLISFDPTHLPSGGLLKEYLATVHQPRRSVVRHPDQVTHDDFMREVFEAVQEFPHDQLFQHYHISGLDIDIVVVKNGQTYCIDLVGYPGNYAAAFPLERIKMLDRMDIRVFSLPFLLWSIDQKRCLEGVQKFLDS